MKKNKGFTLIELMIVVAIIAIIAAIAIPNLLRSRLQSNESATIGNLKAIVSAQTSYNSANNTYAPTFDDLTTATPPFLDGTNWTAATGKSGYVYSEPGGDATTWSVNADPVTFQTTGNRSFFVDASGVIRATDGTADEQADADSNPIGETTT